MNDLVTIARTVAKHTEMLRALRDLLTTAQQEALCLEISCRACGNCCNFARTDHRLFVTAAELALLAMTPPPRRAVPLQCPYQQDNLCTARDRRPLGCRMFYCNSSAQETLHDLYERYHRRIEALHQHEDVPYAYAEGTAWLEAYWVGL